MLQAQPAPALRIGLLATRQGLVQTRTQVRELTQQLNDLIDLPSETALELVDPIPEELGLHSAEEAAERALASNPEVRERNRASLRPGGDEDGPHGLCPRRQRHGRLRQSNV